MKRTLLAVAIAIASGAPLAIAQSVSTGNGGAGGAGGSAAGGQATGGSATNNTSGVSNAVGGSAQGGSGGSASGGQATSNASGGNVGTVSTGGSTASLGDVTVNYNAGSSPLGKDGLGVGVDPETGHVVTDNTVKYSGSYKLKNTPDVSVGGPASGPCNGFSGGLGFSMAGMAIGANASTVDEGCAARETARVAAMIGRMDIANAILENLPAVQAALRSKAAREAAFNAPRSEAPATPAPAVTRPVAEDPKVQATREAALKAQKELDRAVKEAALKEQQIQATEALARNATMIKTFDTLRFTDAESRLNEKTPQQLMAEEASKKLKPDNAMTAEAKPPQAQDVTAEQSSDKPRAELQQATMRKDTQQSQQPGQQAVTTPLPMPTPVQAQPLQSQPQVQASAQQLMSIKSDARPDLQGAAKSGMRAVEMQGGVKAGSGGEKLSQSAEDRTKAARSAFNLH